MTDENKKLNDLAEALEIDTEKAVAHPGEEAHEVSFYIRPDEKGESDFANAINRLHSRPGVILLGIGYRAYSSQDGEEAKGYDEVTVTVQFQ